MLAPSTNAALGVVAGKENFDGFTHPSHKMAAQDTAATDLAVFGNGWAICSGFLNTYYYPPTSGDCSLIPYNGQGAICVGFLAPVFTFAADFITGPAYVNPVGVHLDTAADPQCKVITQTNAQTPAVCIAPFAIGVPNSPANALRCTVTSATPIGGILIHNNGGYFTMDTATWA
ncbi:MAG: hypothetical protein ACYDCK_08600 [Thermoplasmatota archaeon]